MLNRESGMPVFRHLVRMNVISRCCKKGFPVRCSAAFEGPVSGIYSDHAGSILSLLMTRQHNKIFGICLSLEIAWYHPFRTGSGAS